MPPKPAAPESVDAFFAATDHPHRDALAALRRILLAADPSVGEGIKWNAPSFRTPAEWFATFHLRAKQGVQVILHLGAKKRDASPRDAIADPAGLLQWLGPDRATVVFRDAADVEAKADAFTAVVRQWITHV